MSKFSILFLKLKLKLYYIPDIVIILMIFILLIKGLYKIKDLGYRSLTTMVKKAGFGLEIHFRESNPI